MDDQLTDLIDECLLSAFEESLYGMQGDSLPHEELLQIKFFWQSTLCLSEETSMFVPTIQPSAEKADFINLLEMGELIFEALKGLALATVDNVWDIFVPDALLNVFIIFPFV